VREENAGNLLIFETVLGGQRKKQEVWGVSAHGFCKVHWLEGEKEEFAVLGC